MDLELPSEVLRQFRRRPVHLIGALIHVLACEGPPGHSAALFLLANGLKLAVC